MMNKQKVKSSKKTRNLLIAISVGVLAVVICITAVVMIAVNSKSSELVVLDSPDPALMGGWILQNPDNEFELLAFEFGPDSTFVVMNFANGEQVGETMKGKCKYLTVKGVSAIEMKLDSSTETMYYFYTVSGDIATFTSRDTGEVMRLRLVKRVTVAE